MPNVLGIGGLSTSSGTNKLIAAYGNDLVDVDTGTGYGLNVSSTNPSYFESFLDSLFWQNYSNTPKTFNGTTWSNLHVKHVPLARYIKLYGTQMYLANIKINSTEYPSWVWHSDFPTYNGDGVNTIQWGFQSGTNGSVVAGQKIFRAANAGFKTYGIKVGDQLVIENGANAGRYTITRISDDLRVDTLEAFKTTQSSITYWCGSNFLEIKTNNSDVCTWLEENDNRLLIFKRDSLHRYDKSTLREVRGVPGTTSGRSVVNIRGATLYFHGSSGDKTGFYLYDGQTSTNISRKIQPFISGISSSNYDSVVAWSEGDIYRAFVGNISNNNSANSAYNINITNAVISYDLSNNNLTVDPIADTIVARGYLRENNLLKTFIGNSSGEVFQTPSGYSFDGDAIKMKVVTRPFYPRGSEVINVFTRLRIVSRDAGRVTVSYKLWDTPFDVDQEWTELGDLRRGATELTIPQHHNRAAGIQLNFSEIGTKEPVPVVEKVSIYSYPTTVDTPELRQM